MHFPKHNLYIHLFNLDIFKTIKTISTIFCNESIPPKDEHSISLINTIYNDKGFAYNHFASTSDILKLALDISFANTQIYSTEQLVIPVFPRTV
jgi:hypothetical protein